MICTQNSGYISEESPAFGLGWLGFQGQVGQRVGLGDGGTVLGGGHLDALGVVLDQQDDILVGVQGHGALGAAHQLHGGDGVSRRACC